jgi:ubiquinone/menaquinone biosynthesis C-methylase UbiE
MATKDGSVKGSVAFDRAAEYYDQTRAWTPAAMDATVRILKQELGDRGRCLEIGVGTGRVGLPLYRSGVEMAGLDLSRPMMSKLLEKAGGDPFPLVQGDATMLPFREGVFGAALIVHVLHLVPNWRGALDELVRVVRSGGVIVSSAGVDPEEPSMWDEMNARMRKEADLPPHFPGYKRSQEIDDAMSTLGAKGRDLEHVLERRPRSAGQMADLMSAGIFSFTWELDPEALQAAVDRVRAWAIQRYGSLDATEDDPFMIQWRAYDLP